MRQESLLKIDARSLIIELLAGDEVFSLFAQKEFLNSWNALYCSCEWATIYQSKEFVLTWYEIYRNKYLPIIVKETYGKRLTGLLTLAKDRNGLIVGAGASQAEYQTWMSLNSEGRFIKSAISAVKKHFPKNDIQLKFIPGATPLKWAESSLWRPRPSIRVYHQPLLTIDENISTELKKKKRRKKINGLKSLGELSFERITDKQTFSQVFDKLAAQYDFRKGALYNKTPFRTDQLKKQFLLALFDKNILHATVLKLGNEIIASNVAAVGKKWMHLQGVNTHSPCYSKYSPGILHFLFLGDSLLNEGIEILDLTPGENSYKENLATNHLLTYELLIPGSLMFYGRKLREKIFYRLIVNKSQILKTATRIGIEAKDIKNALRRISMAKERIQKVKEQRPRTFIARLTQNIRWGNQYKVFKIEMAAAGEYLPVSKNDLDHLLAYNSKNSIMTRWEFLFDVMQKLEREQEVYSLKKNETLMNCVWLKKKTAKIDSNIKQEALVPTGALILYDFYSHPSANENVALFLKSVIKELSHKCDASIYAIVDTRHEIFSKVMKEIGCKELLRSSSDKDERENGPLHEGLNFVTA